MAGAQSPYPLTYNHRSVVNDYMLREVVDLLRKKGQDARLTPFRDWQADSAVNIDDDDSGVYINIHDEPIRMVGGMLLAGGGEYLFDAAPFIEKRMKDVRCRFGYGSGEAIEVQQEEDESEELAQTLPPESKTAPQQKFHYDSDRQRIYFQLKEYTGISGEGADWIVQTLQVIGKNGPQGRVVYRAHVTTQGATRMNALRSVPEKQNAASDSTETMRMPLPEEMYLKESNEELFQWCLRRDPVEMTAAAKVIRSVIEYYRFAFTVSRTVKSLLRSIRSMQRFVRCTIAKRRVAETRMLKAWSELEQAFKRRLLAHRPLPGDEVDKIVNKMVLQRCETSVEWKRQVIRKEWQSRKSKYAAELRMAGAVSAFVPPFSWAIDPKTLMAIQQKQISDSLATGPDSVFTHRRVQSLFIDSIGEAEIVKQAIAEAQDMALQRFDGRRVPAFGSTTARTGGPELSLTVHVGPPRAAVRSWELRNNQPTQDEEDS